MRKEKKDLKKLEKLLKIKEKFGLTQKQIAQLVNVSQPFVQGVLRGKYSVTPVFSPLFRVFDYYSSLSSACHGLAFLFKMFGNKILIKNKEIKEVQIDFELEQNSIISHLQKGILFKEFKYDRKILETLSLFAEFAEEAEESKWRPELAFSFLLEEGCCCKLQVYASSAFIFQYFSDSAVFDIHGKLSELLCLCLSAKLNLFDLEYPYCISPEYLIYKNTRIFFSTSCVKDVLSKFTKEKKIDLSIFCSSS